jgi:hypothetical protein
VPAPLSCHAVEVPRHSATPLRSHGAVPSRSHAVEEPRPRRGVRRVEQSHASMDERERERVVVAALNLGEMEMNGRE